MDGDARRTLHNTDLVWPNGLTLDYQNQVLYWIDAFLDKIECSNVDGSNRQLIRAIPLFHGFAMTFIDGVLYWSDWNANAIFSVSVSAVSAISTTISGFRRPSGIEVVSENRQHLPAG